jgi:hypothetical protein
VFAATLRDSPLVSLVGTQISAAAAQRNVRAMTVKRLFGRRLAQAWALILAATLPGCALTHETLDHAKENSFTNTKGEKEAVWEAKPGLYAVVPFAVIADVALTPVYVLYFGFTTIVQ